MRKQSGFTLIEIAIVLVIIGLLLGGVLKGQELITSARVRNLISQQDGIKAAYFGFLDRFRALPGDYTPGDDQHHRRPTCRTATATARLNAAAVAAMQSTNTSWCGNTCRKAGFINGSYTYAAAAKRRPPTPTNPYARASAADLRQRLSIRRRATARHNLKTGNQIPVRHPGRSGPQDRRWSCATGGTFRFSRISAPAGPRQLAARHLLYRCHRRMDRNRRPCQPTAAAPACSKPISAPMKKARFGGLFLVR